MTLFKMYFWSRAGSYRLSWCPLYFWWL